jgi:general stress protein YciG
MDEPKTHRPRGFAALCQTPEGRARVSEIARKGGVAAHSAGTAHEFSSDEAREAGRRGGKATHARRREAKETPSSSGTPSSGAAE